MLERGEGGPKLAARDSSDSQAVVEFAVVLPILLFMILGLINLGILINTQIVLTQAAWEGARAGATLDRATGEGDDQIRGAVKVALSGLVGFRDDMVAIDPPQEIRDAMPWPEPRGGSITVTLNYPLTLSLPVQVTLDLEAKATGRIEYSNPP